MLGRFLFVAVALTGALARAAVDVQPFTAGTEQPGTAWIGKALSDGLAADLIDMQNTSGVRIVGSYQTVNGQIRANGQVLNREGQLIGTIRATGDANDLFRIEDALATDARKVVLRASRQRAITPSTAPSSPDEDRPPTRISYTGGLRRNPRVNIEPKLTDPNARAATWRYYYSFPLGYWDGCYSYYGGYRRGYGWSGRRGAFIFAGYQGSTLGAG